MTVPASFRAFRIHENAGQHQAGIETLRIDDLSPGEVTIKTAYSSINYKDALAGTGKGKILRKFPLVGGIDVAGHVVESRDERFREGDAVLVTGCGLSETRDGGYSEYLRLEADWVVPLPVGLSLRESMALGTAGFTAALSLYRMEQNAQTPDAGPVVVTGATGGVGMLAIAILAKAGYEPHALTGKFDRLDDLTALGAVSVVDRKTVPMGLRPLESASWAGAIDNVGGETLSWLTRVIQPYGNIASCGMAGGHKIETTVMPFIIRGVSLLGIASAGTAYAIRRDIWQRLARDWKPDSLERIVTREATLDTLASVFETMLDGDSFGRTVVRIDSN
jgi:putative YhdH/YhfP family quinone oxidoreductase